MMVFVSGLCFSGKRITDLRSFYQKRTLRLVIPVYLFLIAYFALTLFAHWLFGLGKGYTASAIFSSFILLDGIGFVWIIRVFLLVMLLTPALLWLYRRLRFPVLFLVLAIGALALLVSLSADISVRAVSFLVRDYIVLYATGYSIIFLAGVHTANPATSAAGRYVWLILLVVALGYMAFQPHDGFFLTVNAYKYPPGWFYIIYGIGVSTLLYILRPLLGRLTCGFTDFMGGNTMWLYVIHIPTVFVVNAVGKEWHWAVQFAFIFSTAALLTYALVTFSRKAEARRLWWGWKYLRG